MLLMLVSFSVVIAVAVVFVFFVVVFVVDVVEYVITNKYNTLLFFTLLCLKCVCTRGIDY